ncbi:SDR family oxidoreductase [Labrys wisconsinensis]|uniref:NAD(P)-dependent dehydrogenase (Short-subunit alcohol dehydrogenase family) n=1 Tax=Labrys wisconsinensis TaxID=425677 RepID=A0ABU0JI68_9HYPH|nr:SDR family oxidoreductase [Labrys wisconsinensis]MDQ0473975.1 NAD(P)-dependent dehydrogenase (short-subunit alcohol dehydrogenase family) [Labrys wisconsinensis]
MRIDLDGRSAAIIGRETAVIRAAAAALAANGAATRHHDLAAGMPAPPDVLVVGHALEPEAAPDDHRALISATDRLGEAMAERGSGRVIVLTTAMGLLPARRHGAHAVAAAAVVAAMRGLAMRLGPSLQVNAVGAGAIAGEAEASLAAGSEAMLSHVALGQPGTIADIVNAVLFLADPMNSYMTGQLLVVDGGWSAGYGRNF